MSMLSMASEQDPGWYNPKTSLITTRAPHFLLMSPKVTSAFPVDLFFLLSFAAA
jgi:hypothetical protein